MKPAQSAGSHRPEKRENCGIIGVFGIPDAAQLVHLGLYALQHRGQESAGVVASDGREIHSVKGLGLTSEAINPADLRRLDGHIAVGHVRYSTTGRKRVQNIQPLVTEYSRNISAIAHNGNLTNARSLREEYQSRGSIFQTSTDSEIVVHLLADPRHRQSDDSLAAALGRLRGAYSLILMDRSTLLAARDPHGFRPLCLGRLDEGYVVASETCAFDLLGAEYLREVEPGEILRFSDEGMKSSHFVPAAERELSRCIFEYIYFARPDSIVFGEPVHRVRVELGRNLARSRPAEADIVSPVPDSGNSAALGYSRESGIPLDTAFVRNHYVGRTFITPAEESRTSKVRIKLNVVPDVVRGKRVVVVDDSIVRGTTSRARIHTLREAGAKEVHLRISAPPICSPCFYGIDFPLAGELIASDKSVRQIEDFLGVDSLGYQTLDGLAASVPDGRDTYCMACFTGTYPVKPEEDMKKHRLERSTARD